MSKVKSLPTPNGDQMPSLEGLVLYGTVVGRRRKQLPAKDGKPPRWLLILTVTSGTEVLQPERWCDSPNPSDVPKTGEEIALPVRISTFQTKSGTRCSLQWGPSSEDQQF